MKFRQHRGGLKESLETTVEVFTFPELAEVVHAIWPEMTGIKLEHIGTDDRIGWDTYNVVIEFQDRWVIIGQTDGNSFVNTDKK